MTGDRRQVFQGGNRLPPNAFSINIAVLATLLIFVTVHDSPLELMFRVLARANTVAHTIVGQAVLPHVVI